MRTRRTTVAWLYALVVCAGCATRVPHVETLPTPGPEQAASAANGSTPGDMRSGNLAGANARPASAGRSAPGDPRALAEAIGDLQSVGAIDDVARQRLVEELKQTDPVMWPQVLEYFRSSLAYRQQVDRDRSAAAQRSASNASASRMGPNGTATPAEPPRAREPAVHRAPHPVAQAAVLSAVAPLAAAPKPVGRTSATLGQRLTESGTFEQAHSVAGAAPAGLLPSGVVPAAAQAPTPTKQPEEWKGHLEKAIASITADTSTDDPNVAKCAGEAKGRLQDMSARLGELAALQVKNLVFCRAVTSYGVYQKFDRHAFKAGQEVLLYAEIENFKSRSTEKGFHTALKSGYKILDAQGAIVAEQQFAGTEEYCRNRRRDYFVRYFVWLPKKIDPGAYTLQLAIEDTLGQKIGHSSIALNID